MAEYSVFVGGQAGDGIRQAASSIARVLNRLGYWIFVYEDYQSLIRGGRTFSIVRGSSKRVLAHTDRVDVLIALNQDAINDHQWRLKEKSIILFDLDVAKAEGLGLPLTRMAKKRNLPPIVRNTAALGAMASIFGVDFSVVEEVIRMATRRSVEENVSIASEAYNLSEDHRAAFPVSPISNSPRPLLSGNEAVGLGAVKAGMKLYVAYPMTPSSSILHYLAENEQKMHIRTLQPENEIAVIGMAEGAAYAGVRTMVGTSGGGFSLMVEHLSLAGQAEIPIVVLLGQRPGPAIGLPTYHAQGDLFFSMFAGHGEFPRIVIAPGDAEEAFYLSAEALNAAWEFQVPVILLSDHQIAESTFSVEIDEEAIGIKPPMLWDGRSQYKRYSLKDNGISPLAFPGTKGATVKSNSYEHDEYGITTEDPDLTRTGSEKRLRKMEAIEAELKGRRTVKTFGNLDSETAVVTWGSTKGPLVEVCEDLDLLLVQPTYLCPLPVWELRELLLKAKAIVGVEANSTGQLINWLDYHGIKVHHSILKYDGRPFSVEEADKRIKEVIH